MARVIYTGPLNPVIFARAKKEAEKAERIKGYTPRVIKTPAHTVVYSKTGPEVKAVVMDMLAPITFSILGSAIPVRPNFLHLHPDLPEKVYGVPNYATGNGVVQGWGGNGGNYIGDNFNGSYIFPENESSYSVNSSVRLSTKMNTQYMALYNYWDESQGRAPDASFDYKYVEQSGVISVKATIGKHISSSDFNGYSIAKYPAGLGETRSGYVNYSSTVSLVIITKNIRDIAFDAEDFTTVSNRSAAQSSASYSYSAGGSRYVSTREASIGSCSINCEKSVVVFRGDVASPAVTIDNSSKLQMSDDGIELGTYIAKVHSRSSAKITQGILLNIANDMSLSRVIADYSNTFSEEINVTSTLDGPEYQEFFSRSVSESGTEFDKHIFVAGSNDSGGFIGAMIWAKVYNQYPAIEKKQYPVDGVFAKSHLAYYFDIFKGQYARADAPFWEPPDTTTDGICLPHAWFFVRGNETRETDFYPNNHNRLSIVIYPQGRHEFSVDEAEIVSVELDHTPRFVVKPGGSISFNMQAIFDGDPLVPYVVNGLAEERDEDGEPTGFYLAADGAVEGVFKANYQSEIYRLSPRQRLDAYRLITVETTTARKYGVQATFEVFGSGVRVQPGPPSITLECINTSVLAGQTTVFYVTATHIAMHSKLRYEIKRAGAVVSAGYLTIAGGGAGYMEYVAPFTVRPNGGTPQRHVLANPLTGTAAPSVQAFEFSIIHDQAPPPETFSVRYSQESYASASDWPAALPMPPMFFMGASVSVDGRDQFYASNTQQTLINRLYYSLKSKKAYALFWDGQSCEVSSLLKQNPDTGQYEYNPDWKEVPFDYPPAVDPYGTPGALEPYVYAYLEYEQNRNGA